MTARARDLLATLGGLETTRERHNAEVVLFELLSAIVDALDEFADRDVRIVQVRREIAELADLYVMGRDQLHARIDVLRDELEAAIDLLGRR